MIGKSFSHYCVTAKLGAGGMGEVFRASDSRLGRDVALKIVHEAFARDAERMARFEREAHVLASLNHANIGAIYGVEEAGGVRCLVLELVEGPTLLERLEKGALPLEEALPVARQIAEALEAAHERGIVHRDLKPANVKVTPDGAVKVLDFGLAKALEGEPPPGGSPSDASLSPTLTAAATRVGVIIGTAAYMSPEQAKGRPADRRADIWAFGAVLYEMLAGQRAFSGETVSDTLASILKSDPDWDRLPAGTPAAVRRLLRRCLEKDPKRRLRDIGEARIVIEDLLAGRVEPETAPLSPAAAPRRGRLHALALTGVLLAVAAAAGAAGWLARPRPEPPLRKLLVTIEGLEAWYRQSPAISPDGRRLVYAGGGRLFIRDLDQLEHREVPGSEGGSAPFWSPDGAFVGYSARGKLWKAPAGGGPSVHVCDVRGGDFDGAAWGPDDVIVFAPGRGPMYQVSARGGDARPLLEPEAGKETDFHKPHFLPDGRGLLFAVHRSEGTDTLAVLSGGKRKIILQVPQARLDHPVYSPSGHILYRRGQNNQGIWAAAFALSKLEIVGEPFMVAPDGDVPSVSRDGTLAYVSGAGTDQMQLVLVDRAGKIERPIGQPQPGMMYPALSPDGRLVAVSANENENRDVWIHDVARGTRTRLTFDPSRESAPCWSPGGDRVAFVRELKTLLVKPADGTGEETAVAEGSYVDVSPDGKSLVFNASHEGTNDILYAPMGAAAGQGGGEPAVFLKTPANEGAGALSPDGRWLAYVSDESGRHEVYVKRFPGGEGKWQVSVNGGDWPRWSRDGRELFFVEISSLMSVAVETGASLTLGAPRKLFGGESNRVLFVGPRLYDVVPDGRFVMVQPVAGRDTQLGITLVENWLAEFRGGP